MDQNKAASGQRGSKDQGHWLWTPFTLTIIQENTLEEKRRVHLRPVTILSWGTGALLVIALLTYGVICIPFVKEKLVPGYPDGQIRKKALSTQMQVDSMKRELKKSRQYLNNIRGILKGKDPEQIPSETSASIKNRGDAGIKAEGEPKKRADKQKTESSLKLGKRNGVFPDRNTLRDRDGSAFFLAPLRGTVTSAFDPVTGHYGIDIVAPENEAIKAVQSGTVLLASWTAKAGHVIQVQHANDLVSVYKHNAILLKEQGDQVKEGEPIAIIGNTGALTDGPHLHFELWANGSPMDPLNYMTL